jgi:hypothetical protein
MVQQLMAGYDAEAGRRCGLQVRGNSWWRPSVFETILKGCPERLWLSGKCFVWWVSALELL